MTKFRMCWEEIDYISWENAKFQPKESLTLMPLHNAVLALRGACREKYFLTPWVNDYAIFSSYNLYYYETIEDLLTLNLGLSGSLKAFARWYMEYWLIGRRGHDNISDPVFMRKREKRIEANSTCELLRIANYTYHPLIPCGATKKNYTSYEIRNCFTMIEVFITSLYQYYVVGSAVEDTYTHGLINSAILERTGRDWSKNTPTVIEPPPNENESKTVALPKADWFLYQYDRLNSLTKVLAGKQLFSIKQFYKMKYYTHVIETDHEEFDENYANHSVQMECQEEFIDDFENEVEWTAQRSSTYNYTGIDFGFGRYSFSEPIRYAFKMKLYKTKYDLTFYNPYDKPYIAKIFVKAYPASEWVGAEYCNYGFGAQDRVFEEKSFNWRNISVPAQSGINETEPVKVTVDMDSYLDHMVGTGLEPLVLSASGNENFIEGFSRSIDIKVLVDGQEVFEFADRIERTEES